MPHYQVNYIDRVGRRLTTVPAQDFDDLVEARRMALVALRGFLQDLETGRPRHVDVIMINDDRGVCLTEVHLRRDG
jgi:hypothetical protein